MKAKVFFIAAVFVAASEAAISQDNDSEDEIVVVGQLEETTPLKLAEYGNRVEVITAQELQLAGYDDLTQALQMRVPGLYLAPKNGAFDYVGCSLQGSRCQDILLLIDGVRINNRLYNSTSPLDTVPAHIVERIEVLYGGQGIFYGTQSVAGVVNVVTRPLSSAATGAATVGVNGNDGYNVNAEYRNGFGRQQFLVYGSLDTVDGFQPFRSEDYQPSGTDRDRGYDVMVAGAKYAFAATDSSQISLHYQRTENEVEYAAPANRQRSYNERDEDIFTAKYDLRVSDNIDLYVKGYYHDWDSYFTRRDNELDANGMLTGNTIVVSDAEYWGYEDYGLTAVADIRSSHGADYSFGFENQRYSGRDDVLLIDDQTERVDAFFAQIRSSENTFANTQLAFGLRYNKPSGEGDITVWNLSGKHEFTEQLYLRAVAGTAFRSPDAWQLYGNDPCCTLGNPDLEGEESENLNLALGGQLGRFGWEVVAFTRKVDNLIGSENGIRVNTDNRVDFDGFELSANMNISSSWLASIDYTNTTAEVHGTSQQIDDVPDELLKVNATYSAENLPVQLNVSVVHVGDVYDSVSGGIGRVEHGNYTVLDLSGSWLFGKTGAHRIGLRLENVTDEDYGSSLGRAFADADGSSYAYTNLGTPRTLHATYRYSF